MLWFNCILLVVRRLVLEIFPFRPSPAAFLETAHADKHISLPAVVAREAGAKGEDGEGDGESCTHRASLHAQRPRMTTGEIIQIKSKA